MVSGVGDFRQEKGKGNFGLFDLVGADDPTWRRIAKAGVRDAQDAALNDPEFFDEESQELFTWFEEEINRRGRKASVVQRRHDQGRDDAAEELPA